ILSAISFLRDIGKDLMEDEYKKSGIASKSTRSVVRFDGWPRVLKELLFKTAR
ncbi:conserved hypothetical protein, partial [delta proteobacterium NaphS2]